MAMPPLVPDLPKQPPALMDYLKRLGLWADNEIKMRLPKDTAVDHVLLLSPSGKVYKISVNDSGTVTSTLVPLGSHP